MKKRAIVLLVVGIVLLVATFLISRNVVALVAGYDHWKRDRRFAQERDQEIAGGIHYYETLIARSQDEKEKRLAALELRILRHVRSHSEIASLVHLEDGVDEVDAFLIARAYFSRNIGLCGDVGLPELKGAEWIIPIFIGRKSAGAPPDPPIIIDARTGSVSCTGYPKVSDPKIYFIEHASKRPNQALEHNAYVRHAACEARVAPATGVAHL